jgi:epoxyqueuosine reductase
MIQKSDYTLFVKTTAQSLGFDYCGIARAAKLDEEARYLESWLNKGYNGKMAYMENYFDLRTDPTKLVPGAKSVITLPDNNKRKTYRKFQNTLMEMITMK